MHIFCPPLYWFCNILAIVWKYICSALQMWKTYIHIRGSIKHPHIVCVMSTNQTHLYFWHQIHYILIMICLVPSFPLIGHVLFWIFHDITSIMTTRGQRWSSSLDQPCRPMHLDEALLIGNTRWFSWAAFFLRSSTLSILELILSPPLEILQPCTGHLFARSTLKKLVADQLNQLRLLKLLLSVLTSRSSEAGMGLTFTSLAAFFIWNIFLVTVVFPDFQLESAEMQHLSQVWLVELEVQVGEII